MEEQQKKKEEAKKKLANLLVSRAFKKIHL